MKQARVVVLMMGIVAGVAGCRPQSEPDGTQAQAAVLANREEQLARRVVAGGDTTPGAPLAMWILPPELREISGLALTADARLLAHDDERGIVYVIDPRRGVMLKRFSLGEKGLHADFEGITVTPTAIYLLASNGNLYQFDEGADGERVRYTLHNTRLGRECEFEGVAFEPVSARLLMPCKNVGEKSLRDKLVIYRWHLQKTESPRLSMLTIPLAQVIGSNGWKSLHPSDVTVDPATGNYVLIAAQEKAFVEITPAGEVVRSGPLPGGARQPEGVAITADSILIVSDEGTKGAATLTLYRWPIGAAPGASQ